jgi:hypothetical protein
MYHDESRVFLHHLPGYPLPDLFAFKSDDPVPAVQEAVLNRLIAYYHRLRAEFSNKGMRAEFSSKGMHASDDFWQEIVGMHQDLEAVLQSRDPAKVSHLMVNLCRHPTLVFGFMHYTNQYPVLEANPLARQKEALFLVDKLLALAESIGILPAQTPEQGHWGYSGLDIAALLTQIQARVPFPMTPPAAGGGSFGFSTNHGVMCMKDIQAIYAAIRVRDLLSSAPTKTVLEIGGGTGTLAYYLAKAGVEQISIFDLPTVSVMQAYYLMRSLGPDEVTLYGENTKARVRLLPYWQLENEPAKSHALAINLDSLPEIEHDTALNYMRLIKEKVSGHFWSVNQEGQGRNTGGKSQNVVWHLIEKSGGFRRMHRFPHWLRAGWIEELYEIL